MANDGSGWDGINSGSVTYDNMTGIVFIHYIMCGHNCTLIGCQRPPECGPEGTGRTFYVSSNSSFEDWSPPVEITHQLGSWSNSYDPGPGEGVQTSSGRLVICGWAGSAGGAATSALILSDDHGLHWRGGAKLSDVSVFKTSECDGAMLRNGSVLISFRNEGPGPVGAHRIQARSDDEGQTFVRDSVRVMYDLPAHHCMASMIRAFDVLYMSYPQSNLEGKMGVRANLTISASFDEGNSWSVLTNVYPLFAGYSSLTAVGSDFGGSGDELAILYNRGETGDGCVGNACPYDTTVSFAMIPLSSNASQDSDDHSYKPDERGEEAAAVKSSTPFLALGWWCQRPPALEVSYPDAPGIFENVDLVVATVAPASCTTSVQHCHPVRNYTELLFGASRGFPQPLLNGSMLHSAIELVQFGRERWHTEKFVFAEVVGSQWMAIAKDAYCYMSSQRGGGSPEFHTGCGDMMRSWSYSLCSALQRARLTWWLFDASALDVDLATASWLGPGTAQSLRFFKQTCQSSYNVSVRLGWVMPGDTGRHSFIFTRWDTWSVESFVSVGHFDANMVSFVDYFLPTIGQHMPRTHYFTNNGAAYPGECSAGRDEKIMSWSHWAGVVNTNGELTDHGYGMIPASQLVVGLPTVHTAVYGCPAGHAVDSCLPNQQCSFDDSWVAGGLNKANGHEALLHAVVADKMNVSYDTWSQQQYFGSSDVSDCPSCVNWIDAGGPRDYDFALRHAAWRGLGGIVSLCVDSDYTQSHGGRHWQQPVGTFTRFHQSSVFQLGVGAASTKSAAGGLDVASGDSLCRLFGGRIATQAQDVADSISVDKSTVHCFGQRPQRAPDVWPLILLNHTAVDVEPSEPLVENDELADPGGKWVFHNGSVCYGKTFKEFPHLPLQGCQKRCLTTPGCGCVSHNGDTNYCRVEEACGGPAGWTPGFGMSCRVPSLFQLTTKSSANISSSFSSSSIDIERLATDETYMREVPITPDAGRVLAALVSGVVATQAQVTQAAAAGVQWPQLGLTINRNASTSWAGMVGAAPDGKTGGMIFNSLQMFDGGTTGLSAVNGDHTGLLTAV
jgi:sialidase-1